MAMQIRKREMKTVECAYLYGDGHCVLCHGKTDEDAGRVEWVTIYESIGPECRFEGRIVIHWPQACLPFIQMARRVEVTPPSIEKGSQNTKDKGIPVGHIKLYAKESDIPMYIDLLPGILSGQFTYQESMGEEFDPYANQWGVYHVKATYSVSY